MWRRVLVLFFCAAFLLSAYVCGAGNMGAALAGLIFIFVMSCRLELRRLRHKYAGRWSQRGASRPIWPGL
jgi:hypothetical protein